MVQVSLDQWVGKRIHFIGIAGAGMSGLARIALSHGLSVSGSDSKDSSVVLALRALGAEVHIGHNAAHLDGVDIVIYSNAITASNAEIMRSKELELPLLTRAQALATLMSSSKSLAVAGTHGKTTTSSMLTVALQTCGVDPLQLADLSPHQDQMLTVEPESYLWLRQMNQMAPSWSTTHLAQS